MRFASLIISAWNRPELLEASLKSLWDRTTYPHEIIVHDDGSQRKTTEMLYDFLTDGMISSLILNPPSWNRGHGTSVNRAASIAEGDVIVKLNGDEVFATGWLEKTVEALDLFPEIGLLHLAYYYQPLTRETPIEQVVWDYGQYTLHRETRNGIPIRVVWTGPGCGFAVRKKDWKPWAAEKQPGFGEDVEFRWRMCPMMRLPGFMRSKMLPPVVDLEKHWQEYKSTPWLALLEPPVVSYHPGEGKSSIQPCQATLRDGPYLLGG